MFEAITNWDMSVLNWIYEHLRNPVLNVIMPLITHLGDAGILWIIIAVIMVFTKKYRKCGITMGLALIIGLIIGNGIIKNLVARMRPYDYYDKIHGTKDFINILIGKQSDYAFPSGHTQASFAAATSIFLYHKKEGIAALAVAILISFSRLYVFVHYPTDVFAGIIFGISWAVISFIVIKKVYEIKSKKESAI